MSDYGVQITGYVRKPLAVILQELETKMISQFGAEVIQTAQSPLGQLNGLMADFVAELYEYGEDIYQSYDPDQAEGNRLDTLGWIRLLRRGTDENDASYRQAITNAGRSRNDIQDLRRAIVGLDGVTYAQVFVNDTGTLDPDTLLPGGTIAVAVLGGLDDEIGAAMRQFIVPGIDTYGNVQISTNIEGYCRNFNIVRPILVPVTLSITIHRGVDLLGCPAPGTTQIKQGVFESMKTLINGEDITIFRVRRSIEGQFENVEVKSFIGERDGDETGQDVPVNIGFIELATVALDDITLIEV